MECAVHEYSLILMKDLPGKNCILPMTPYTIPRHFNDQASPKSTPVVNKTHITFVFGIPSNNRSWKGFAQTPVDSQNEALPKRG